MDITLRKLIMNSKRLITKQLVCTLGAVAGAAILISSSPSFADDNVAQDHKAGHHFGAEGMQKHLDKLKADLKIQPSQEGAWQAYAQKVKEKGEKMKALHQQAHANANLTLPERLDQQISFMKQREANMEEMAVTLKALYATLTPEQRVVMDKHFSHRKRHRG
jgi:Spy/CpxP family protein refolding chaperone